MVTNETFTGFSEWFIHWRLSIVVSVMTFSSMAYHDTREKQTQAIYYNEICWNYP